MQLRIPTTRATLFVAVVLTLIAVPAVAWALTSPKTTVDVPAEGESVHGRLDIGGQASHRVGVAGVRLVIKNLETDRYWNGSAWQSDFIRFDIPVNDPGASETRWSYSVSAADLEPGEYRARAFAYSVEGNGDGFGGDWNEFSYVGRYDPDLYTTDIAEPSDGATVGAPIVIRGSARSSAGVESVRVVVRNKDTNRYWNDRLNGWQATFATVQAVLSEDGGTQSAWTVEIPAERSAPGSYFARAWVRTTNGLGDPIGRGRTNFVVEKVTTTTTAPSPTTTAPTPTTSSTAPTTTEGPTTTTEKPTTTQRPTTTVPTTTQRPTTTVPTTTSTVAPPTTTPPITSPPTTTPSGCRTRTALEPCEGVIIGSSGDFTDEQGRRVNKQEHFMARERELGAEFDLYHDFLQWNDLVTKSWPNANTQALADDGRILFINWKSATGHPRDWADIADGDYDADIRTAARQVAAFGEPIFVTFFHEPEDNIRDASNGDAVKVQQYLDDYSDAFRHLHDMFETAGADNVVWVWDVQGYLRGWESYYLNGLYPGDDVIDWIGFNNYNWYNCHDNAKWKSFTDVVSPFYDWLDEGGANRPSTDKPIMLGEFGSEENLGSPTSDQTKGQWLNEAARVLPTRFPRLKAAVYFDTEGRNTAGVPQFCDWALDSSPGSMAAMRAMLNDPNLDPVMPGS